MEALPVPVIVLIFIAGLIAVSVSILVNGFLLYVGWRYLARGRKARYWRSVKTIALAALGSGAASVLICLVGYSHHVLEEARIVGGLVGLAVAWWIISEMLHISYGKAILAWLPTQIPVLLALPFFLPYIFPPAS